MPLLIQELNGEVHPVENNIVITNDSFAKLEKKKTVEISVERQSVWKDIWKELKKNKVAMVSVVLLAILIIAVLLAPLSPYDPYKLDASQKLQGISSSHWFGTDEYGRDYFTRTLYGGRVSLLVGFMSMIMTVVIGTSLGVFSGYVGGKVDMFLMSFTDIFLALPSMLLMVILNTFLKPGLPTLIVVLSLFSWASVARITRAETMSLKERDFVVATQNLGASNFRVIIKHIIPNILGPVIVAASLSVAKFPGIRCADSTCILGKYASGSTGAYFGLPFIGGISGRNDPNYSFEL